MSRWLRPGIVVFPLALLISAVIQSQWARRAPSSVPPESLTLTRAGRLDADSGSKKELSSGVAPIARHGAGWVPPPLPQPLERIWAEYDQWLAENFPGKSFWINEESVRIHAALCDKGLFAGCTHASVVIRALLQQKQGSLGADEARSLVVEQRRLSLRACLNGIASECEFDLPGASGTEPHLEAERTMRHFCESGLVDYCGSLGARLKSRIPADLSEAHDGQRSEAARADNRRRMNESLDLLASACDSESHRCVDLLADPGGDFDDDPRVRRAYDKLKQVCDTGDRIAGACAEAASAAFARNKPGEARAYHEKACGLGAEDDCLRYLDRRDQLKLNSQDVFAAISFYCKNAEPNQGNALMCDLASSRNKLDAATYRAMKEFLDLMYRQAG